MRRRRPSSLEAFLSMPPHNFTSCISIGCVVTGDAPCKDGLEAEKDGSHPVHELVKSCPHTYPGPDSPSFGIVIASQGIRRIF